ncbi:MAG: hypothetical protein QM723_29240 [Myxococcaceae bacterium]
MLWLLPLILSQAQVPDGGVPPAAPPAVDRKSVVFQPEAGQVTVEGKRLTGATLSWQSAGQAGQDVCDAPQPRGTGEVCVFAVPKGLSADPDALTLWVLAPGAVEHAASDGFHPAKVWVEQLVAPDAVVDLEAESSRVRLKHAEAVASVDCTDADCELDGDDVVVRREQGNDELLDLKVKLRPHIYYAHGGAADPAPSLSLPLSRCPASIVSPPFRSSHEQVLVVKVAGKCATSASLSLRVAGQALNVLKRASTPGAQWLAGSLLHTADEVTVTVLQGGKIVGVARAATRTLPAQTVTLELPQAGAIDFVPTNREALARLPVMSGGGALALLPVEGAYQVRQDEHGDFWLSGTRGAGGQVALKLALRDPSLPDGLAQLDLFETQEPTTRRIAIASLAVPLAAQHDAGLVELRCGDGLGHPAAVEPGVTAYVPFEARDTCRLVFHRERLKTEDGPQKLSVDVRVVAEDGSARADAQLRQTVTLGPGATSSESFLSGVQSAFDRLTVRVSRADDGEKLFDANAVGQLQWSVVFGLSRLRLFATTSFPSGLFRVADAGHSGILTLNAGAIARLVWLSKEGHESPLGAEAGLMWVGIAGDTEPQTSAHGQIAVVLGVGVSVPIANQGHATQTSISLHGWVEYEVSRAFGGQHGSPWGFVFGPALTIGDVGTNL